MKKKNDVIPPLEIVIPGLKKAIKKYYVVFAEIPIAIQNNYKKSLNKRIDCKGN